MALSANALCVITIIILVNYFTSYNVITEVFEKTIYTRPMGSFLRSKGESKRSATWVNMLKSSLPAPRGNYDEVADEEILASSVQVKNRGAHIPPYPHRAGFVPRSRDDYGDGGAYPEIPTAQYPLDMGRPGVQSAVVSLEVDAKGRVQYDALAKQGRVGGQLVHTSLADTKERGLSQEHIELPTADEENATAERTRMALEVAMTGKIKKSGVQAAVTSQEASEMATYVRYTPNPDVPGFQATAAQRVIKVVEAQVDPMEPPKHKVKKTAFRPDTDNVPVLHAPDKITQAEAAAWKIPPMVSNWKNDSGFVISLDKRLAADGRGAQEVTINNKFATLSEALYVAEKKAAEDLRLRNAIRRSVAVQEKADKESELREMAARARMERAGLRGPGDEEEEEEEEEEGGRGHASYSANVEPNIQGRRGVSNMPAWMTEQQQQEARQPRKESIGGTPPDTPPYEGASPPQQQQQQQQHRAKEAEEDEGEKLAMQQREELREQKKLQRQREQRGSRKTKDDRDAGRDISEKVALGQHTGTGGGAGVEASYDSRLFNQSAGLDSGFGADDTYEAYTAPMFDRGDVGSGLYRAQKDEGAGRGTADEQMAALKDTTRFRADKGFQGTEGGTASAPTGPRNAPVQFEKAASSSAKSARHEEDVFGIGEIVDTKRTRRE